MFSPFRSIDGAVGVIDAEMQYQQIRAERIDVFRNSVLQDSSLMLRMTSS